MTKNLMTSKMGFRAYTTTQEHRFLDGLGTYSLLGQDRQTLLRGYYVGSLQRDDWGDIDRDHILSRVARELNLVQPWPHRRIL